MHRFSCWYLYVVSCISVACSVTRKKDCTGQADTGAEVEHCVPAEDVTTTDNHGVARKCMSQYFHPSFRFPVLLFWNCLLDLDLKTRLCMQLFLTLFYVPVASVCHVATIYC